MSFRNFTIGERLTAAFAAVLVLLLIVLGLGLNSMAHIQSHLENTVNENNVKVAAANEMASLFRDTALYTTRIVFVTDAAILQAQLDKLQAARKKYAVAKTVIAELANTDDEKAILAKLDAGLAVAVPISNKTIELGLQGKKEEAIELLLKKHLMGIEDGLTILEELIAYEQSRVATAMSQALEDHSRARTLMLAFTALAIAVGTLVGWLTTRSITGPIHEAVKIAETVAAGNLTSQIVANSQDEPGRLLQALGTMNQSLVNIVSEVRCRSDAIAGASDQVVSGHRDLSIRTELQKTSLEQTVLSMEELTLAVKRNADNARHASEIATSASGIAVTGGRVVSNVVETMTSISASSKRIVDIIGIIDGIAFQTNVLALNAAVEAARAGEHGKGFAVVASEVRCLAHRSAEAAKEIKGLIGDSVDEVEAGQQLADQAGNTMKDVVHNIQLVTNIISEISSASETQSEGIAEIKDAMSHMDQATQQNAALVEEATAASEAMHEQLDQLRRSVGIFQLGRVFRSS